MAMYESDYTIFMREWMEKNPQERDEQKKGRALWWDKAPMDADSKRRIAESTIPPKPYYYDAN